MHMIGAAWVHNVPFNVANLSPVWLGLAVAAARLRVERPIVARFQLALLSLAILCAAGGPAELIHWGSLAVSPLRITMLATVAAAAYAYKLHLERIFVLSAALLLASAMLGPTPAIMWESTKHLVRDACRIAGKTIPTTASGWGIASIAGAFVMLGFGVLLTRSRREVIVTASDQTGFGGVPAEADDAIASEASAGFEDDGDIEAG